MKKTITLLWLAMAGIAGMQAQTATTDVIDLAWLRQEAAKAGVTVGDFDPGVFGPQFTTTAEGSASGVSYRVGCAAEGTEGNMRFATGGFIASTENPSGMYVKKVTFHLDGYGQSFSTEVNGRDTAVEYHHNGDFMVPNVGLNKTTWSYYPGNTAFANYDGNTRWECEAPKKHVVISNIGARYISKIEIVWESEAPTQQVSRPMVNVAVDAMGNTPSPTEVGFMCDTENASIHYVVTRNGEAYLDGTEKPANIYRSVYITLTGEVDDIFDITATGVRSGWLDSEPARATVVITASELSAPESPLFDAELPWKAVAGRSVTITNPNGTGTLHYEVNGTPFDTAETEITLTVPGVPGDTFAVKAWVEKAGFKKSEVMEYEGRVSTSALAAPMLSPAPGEVRAGTQVIVSSPEAPYAAALAYRFDNGEWSTTDDFQPFAFTVNDAVEFEAYYVAATEGEYAIFTDGDHATGAYTVEVLDPAKHTEILPGHFTETNYLSNATEEATVNGVKWEYNGSVYGEYSTPYFSMVHWNENSYCQYLRNLEEVANGISAVKVTYDKGGEYDMAIYFSDSKLDLSGSHDDLPQDVRDSKIIITPEDSDCWIPVAGQDAQRAASSAPKYMLLAPMTNGATHLQRVVVSHPQTTGVETIESDAQTAAYYTADGLPVADPTAQGIYIRVHEGKASKVLIR